jgi:PAS domain S-box-containing protein
MNQLNIKSKLTILVLSVVIIFMLLGGISINRKITIHDMLKDYTARYQPLKDSAYELEINAIGIGFGVLGYLHDRDPMHLARIRKDQDDFAHYSDIFIKHADGALVNKYKTGVLRLFTPYVATANQLIEIENDISNNLSLIIDKVKIADDILDDSIQPQILSKHPINIDHLNISYELEINLYEIVYGINSYLGHHGESQKHKLYKDIKHLEHYSQLYNNLNLSNQPTVLSEDIHTNLLDIISVGLGLIKLHDLRESKLNELVSLRRSLDDELDDVIQIYTDFMVKENLNISKKITRDSIIIIIVACCASIGLFLIISFFIVNSIIKPIDQLARAAKIIKNGDFGFRVAVSSKDEIGLLGITFNFMADEIQAKINKLCNAEASLLKGKKDLETKVKARTKELVYANEALVSEAAQRQELMRSLRSSENRYRVLVENARDAIFTTQGDTIRFANNAAIKMLGIEDYKSGSLSLSPLIMPSDSALASSAMGMILNNKKNFVEFHCRLVIPDKSFIWVDWRITAIQWEGGSGLLHFLTDVTKQKEIEKQINQTSKLEAVGTLTSGIAHDFNNIIQAITNNVELALINDKLPDSIYNYIKQIGVATGKATDLIKQFLLFSRKWPVELKPLEINNVVTNVLALLERTIPKMINIKVSLSDDIKMIKADEVGIEQILINLVVNAKDAMPNGGNLVVSTENVLMDDIYDAEGIYHCAGEYVLLSIADDGCGIDKETISHIYEPFFTTKDREKGTGLGLSTVYGIVKTHQGYIDCQSDKGIGTVFKIYLPAILGEVKKNDQLNDKAAISLKGIETILIVDDESAIRESAKEALEILGYKVFTAWSAEEALELIKNQKMHLDVIILDLIMPGKGGQWLLNNLHSIKPNIKIIIASGCLDIFDDHHKLINASINKPYKLGDLLRLVREVIDSE